MARFSQRRISSPGGGDDVEGHSNASPSSAIAPPHGLAINPSVDTSSRMNAASDGPATTGALAADDGRRAPPQHAAQEPTASLSHEALGNRSQPVGRDGGGQEAANVAPGAATHVAKATSIEPGAWLVEDVARSRGQNRIPDKLDKPHRRMADRRHDSAGPDRGVWTGVDPNMCGYVSRTKNPNDTDKNNTDPTLRDRSIIGVKVLLDMKPSARGWNGNVYNAQDGNIYAAHMVMRSADTLRVEGCALGGLVCGGQNWTRID